MTTLNEILNLPFTNKIDISYVPIEGVMEVLQKTYGSNAYSHGDCVQPETEALDFYMANHVIALIRTKSSEGIPLGNVEAELVAEYAKRTSDIAVRAFSYLLLICTREMRHLQSSSAQSCGISIKEKPVYAWIKETIQGINSSKAASQIWSGNVPFDMGEYTTVLEKMFRYGGWSGGGFGGAAWAEVTKCLRDYVHGLLTAEMMVDTVWTLCHNNGPIFNKGMLYHGFTAELYRVLDVQRAGQVPQYKWEEYLSGWYMNFLSKAAELFPELMDDPSLDAIKATAIHPNLWTHVQMKKSTMKVIKPGGHGVDLITEKMEIGR